MGWPDEGFTLIFTLTDFIGGNGENQNARDAVFLEAYHCQQKKGSCHLKFGSRAMYGGCQYINLRQLVDFFLLFVITGLYLIIV